jgi:hypothetical protein
MDLNIWKGILSLSDTARTLHKTRPTPPTMRVFATSITFARIPQLAEGLNSSASPSAILTLMPTPHKIQAARNPSS